MGYTHFDKLSTISGYAVGADGSESDIWTSSETLGTSAASKVLSLDSSSELNSVGVIQSATAAISGADVYGMSTTPVSVIAAPGAGVYTEFLGAYVFLDYGTTQFDFGAGEDLVFRYTNGSGGIVSQSVDSALLNGAADAVFWVGPVGGVSGTPTAYAMTGNAAVVAHVLVGDGTAGDSVLKILAYYREVRAALLTAIA